MKTNLDTAREVGAEFYAEWERNTVRFTPDRLDAFAAKIIEADRLARQEPEPNTGLLAALKNLLPFVEDIQDAGPIGEGWQSDALLIAIDDAQKAINKAEYGPAILDGGTGNE